jgi:hypothetical protein
MTSHDQNRVIIAAGKRGSGKGRREGANSHDGGKARVYFQRSIEANTRANTWDGAALMKEMVCFARQIGKILQNRKTQHENGQKSLQSQVFEVKL